MLLQSCFRIPVRKNSARRLRRRLAGGCSCRWRRSIDGKFCSLAGDENMTFAFKQLLAGVCDGIRDPNPQDLHPHEDVNPAGWECVAADSQERIAL